MTRSRWYQLKRIFHVNNMLPIHWNYSESVILADIGPHDDQLFVCLTAFIKGEKKVIFYTVFLLDNSVVFTEIIILIYYLKIGTRH